MKAKLAASFLAIILFVSAFAVFPFVDAGKGIRVVGSMKDDGRILILVQNASDNDLYNLKFESFTQVAHINRIYIDEAWHFDIHDRGKQVIVKTDTKPVKMKESMRFYVTVDSPSEVRGLWVQLKFKWTGYNSTGGEIAKGAFTVKNTLVMGFDYSKIIPPSLCQGHATCNNGDVTRIVDGDTLDISFGPVKVTVRLTLVNTPEVNEPLYNEAKQFTASLCPVGSNVLVDEDDGQTEGSYGRMIAKVFCGDKKVQKVLNAELLYSDLAVIDQRFCNESEFASEDWAQHYGCGQMVLEEQEESTPPPSPPEEENCDPSYPDVCIPPPPPDLDCPDVPYKNFRVLPPDPHRFDGDKDGIGCET